MVASDGRLTSIGLFLLALCGLLVTGNGLGDDCRERIPNGHKIPFQQYVEGSCSGVQNSPMSSPYCFGGAVTAELNPFGKDFMLAGEQWTPELCAKDSDGDGFTNGEELGDPCCIWHEEGEVPQWMKDWSVSHPGFANSTQTDGRSNLDKMCKKKQRLKPESFYAEGEPQIPLEYEIEPFPLIDGNETADNVVIYQSFVYNLPRNMTFNVVGLERWFENEEFLKYLVKHEVSFCSEVFQKEGEKTVLDPFDDKCLEKIYMWKIGSTSKFILPKSTGFLAGNATNRISFTSRYTFRPPRSKTNLTTIRSVLRFHTTTTKRKHQLGVLRADFYMKTEVFRPDTMYALSNIFQIKVNHTMAPKGVKVVGYIPGDSQHYTMCKTWIEKLKRTSGRTDQLHRLTELEKVGDLGRDVQWFDEGSDVRLSNGEYLSNTCMYDSTDPGTSIELERCYASIYYYPAEAMDYVLGYTGPVYINPLSDEQAKSMSSVTHFFPLPTFNTQLPLWRQLYLSGTYRCNRKYNLGIANTTETTYGASGKLFQLRAPCRKGKQLGNFEVTEGRLAFPCSPECALIQFNVMGCSLLKDGVLDDGEILSLYPSPLEALGAVLCGAEYERIYDDYLKGLTADLASAYGMFSPPPTNKATLTGHSLWRLVLAVVLAVLSFLGAN